MKKPRPKRILAVDDDPLVRRTLSLFFKRAGHDVTLADGGEEGLSRFVEGSFDLLITDIRMPGMDGIRLIEAVREYQTDQQNKEIPIVILTAYNDEPVKQSAERLGVKQMMFKPFEPQALQEAIELILAG